MWPILHESPGSITLSVSDTDNKSDDFSLFLLWKQADRHAMHQYANVARDGSSSITRTLT